MIVCYLLELWSLCTIEIHHTICKKNEVTQLVSSIGLNTTDSRPRGKMKLSVSWIKWLQKQIWWHNNSPKLEIFETHNQTNFGNRFKLLLKMNSGHIYFSDGVEIFSSKIFSLKVTILCLYVPGFQRQVFKHVQVLSQRSKKLKEEKKHKGSVPFPEFAYISQKAHFGLVEKKNYKRS